MKGFPGYRQLLTSITALLLFVHCAAVQPVFADEPVNGNASGDATQKQTASASKKSKKDAPKISSKKKSSKDSKSSDANKSTKPGITSKSTKTASKSSKSSKNKSGKVQISARDIEIAETQVKADFSKKEIATYQAMDYETWESPREVSELGLKIEPGFAQPYPYGNLMRQFCTDDKHRHKGHDIGTVGEKNGGMGSVINAVVRSQITLIGRTGEDVGEFGKLDKRSGMATRTGKSYPRQILVPGYGVVYPFSLNYGRWRSGYVIVTKVLDGPLKDSTVRYMHMGGIRPDLKVGSIVDAGEHIAVMGSTAIMDSPPHVHIDAETPTGARIDLGPYIGIPASTFQCRGKGKVAKKPVSSSKKSTSAKKSTTSPKTSSPSKKATGSSNLKKRSRNAYTASTKSTEKARTRTLDRNS